MNLLALVLIISIHISLAFAAQTITVIVAPQGRLEYDPPYVRMGPGDTVLFIFQDAKHSVTQSEPDKPCVKLGVGSDTQIAPSTIGTREEHSFTLYDSYNGEPRYFYSATRCQDGMVFAINPPAGALDSYRAAARNTASSSPPPSSPPPQVQPQPNPPPVVVPVTVTVGGSVTTVIPEPSPNPQQPNSNPASNTPADNPAPSPSGESVANGSPTGSSAASPRPTESGLPARPGAPGSPYEHIIGVGDDGLLTFSPARIQALVGDVVTFEVRSQNHSIVQSSFDAPCQPLVREDGHLGFRSGILSGGKTTAGDFAKFSKFSIQVNDTTPIYAFDGQTEHCKSGMVFAVNVKSEDFTAFQENARLGPSRTRAEGDASRTSAMPLISLATIILSLLVL